MNDFSIRISTENGTGSMTANKILLRSFLSEGFYANSKNLFPSNIAGLPTTFYIRISKFAESSYRDETHLYVGFNKKTLTADTENLNDDTFCIFNANFKLETSLKNNLSIDCRKLARELHSSASTKKLLYNMLYVGAVLKLTGCKAETGEKITRSFFKKLPQDIIDANVNALKVGFDLVTSQVFEIEKHNTTPNYLYEGNNCSALGFLDGGGNVATWYPITPSSSVVETFEKMNTKYFPEPGLRSVLQCEDEIASAVSALGAGWSGSRAFTATSGPGLSLMQEALGLGYYSESPFVILDVQRAGPSTGLPTRTAQGDLLQAHYSSHGDTIHPVLLPGTPQESYDDAFESLNLAHALQSPVLILSDLDSGMNEWSCHSPLKQKETYLNKGKVQLKERENFKRYSNSELVSTRSIPRISDSSLAYFTRGSGHAEDGSYSEDPDVYEAKLLRLKSKILESKNEGSDGFKHYPKDIKYVPNKDTNVCVVTWGSTGQIESELKGLLPFDFAYLRIRSLPMHEETFKFLSDFEQVFVVEQNRDGQLNQIIKSFSPYQLKTTALNFFNGLPIDAKKVAEQIDNEVNS